MINKIKENSNILLWIVTAMLFALFAYILLYRLGVHAYIDWDEAIYAQVAKEMFLNHSYFNLTFYGIDWYEKPPLAFWVISLFYGIGGITEWMGRLPVVIFTLSTVLLSLRWVYELRKSALVVLLTMSCFFLPFAFITGSYFINLDSMAGFFILVTAYSWYRAQSNPKWYMLFGIALGLGVMTKSIVALFILVPILATVLIYRQFSILKDKHFWKGVLLFLLIAAPWHVYMSIANGSAFWNNYLIYHVLKRASSNLESNGAPFDFFIRILFTQYYQALIVFGGSVVFSIWYFIKQKNIVFIWLSFISLLLIISSSITKLAPYVIIAVPFLVILTGLSLHKLISLIKWQWLRVFSTVSFIFAIVLSGYSFNSYKLAKGETTMNYHYQKQVGRYLRDNFQNWPVYIFPVTSERMAISHYAGKFIKTSPDELIQGKALVEVFHTNSLGVFQGEDYLVVIWR